MALDPMECHMMSRCQRVQLPPQIFVLYRQQFLPRSSLPAVGLPLGDPLGDALFDILGVCEQLDVAGTLQLSQRGNGGHQFHAIVRRRGISAGDFLAQASTDKNGPPPAGSRIATACSICIDRYVRQDGQGYRIP